MHKLHLTLFAGALLLGACSQQDNPASSQAAGDDATAAPTASAEPATVGEQSAAGNPLLQKSELFLQAPPFDKIEASDFMPAFKTAMASHLDEIEKIANNPADPTFENTLVAMEKAGLDLGRVQRAFGIISSADTNPEIQEIKKQVAPLLAAHRDAVHLNDTLFQRIKSVYQQRETLNLDPESARLLEVTYNEFVHAGANLSKADKAKLKDINKKLSTLSATFETKLHDAIKDGALIINDKSKLAGLSDAAIEAAAGAAKERGLEGKWLIPLENTTQQASLADLDNRAVRYALFQHSWTRAEKGGNNDTRKIVSQMAALRADKADLLGFDNYAAWKLSNQMAKTPEHVFDFVRALVEPTNAKAREEAAARQALMSKGGTSAQLKAWDWMYYGKQVRKDKYGIDSDKVKQYFELENVLENGVFYAAHKLYGLTFKERHDLPVWHDGVRVFEVHNEDGSLVGLFYADYYKRDSKSGGAWMSNLVPQSYLLGTKPVIYNVANFPKPAPGEPALLSWDEVTTMFHEFGHALHGFFADQKYVSLSGTNTARDWVEFPSQFNEHWASYPEIFKHYAVHYKTGEPMPQALVDKLDKSRTFGQGYSLGELLAAALLDMSWHTLPATAPPKNVDKFEAKALEANNTDLPYLPPRYRSSYFLHIWGHGYSAGYYAYLWTEMLADDAYHWFEEHGGLSRENGDQFRKMILSRGNSQDLAKMWHAFYGSAPDVEPMLKARGID